MNLSHLRYLLFMKMAALQLMQQKANKNNKTAALQDSSNADKQSDSKPQSAEASDKVIHTTTPSSESALAPEECKSTATPENSASENKEALASLNAANTNGTHEPSDESQNGGCDSPLEGKEADENIPGLAQAKELAESLAAEDGSGIGTSRERPERALEGTRARAGGDMHSCFLT